MNLTSEQIKKYQQKLLLSRFRILNNHGLYGLLLMHMKLGLDLECDTAYTDGYSIKFSPTFLDDLSDKEVDFVLMHEILHVVLKHCFRGRGKDIDPTVFNIACDIVVNSNILYSNNMDKSSITLKKYGEAMNKTPTKDDGYKYTVEEVYKMLIDQSSSSKSKKSSSDGEGGSPSDSSSNDSPSKGKSSSNSKGSSKCGDYDFSSSFDNHDKWEIKEDNQMQVDEWETRLVDAYKLVSLRDNSEAVGKTPLGLERLANSLINSTINWKVLLNDFLSYEVSDYSFLPPDRRYQDDIFMPDFNELEASNKLKVYVYIDTSGSIEDNSLREFLSELKGALDSFPALEGIVTYFDAICYESIEFTTIEDVLSKRISGGGGTSFYAVFDHLKERIKTEDTPACVIIFTDGYALYPDEKRRMDIPVLWILDNENMTPPWGIVARIEKKK